MSRVLFVDWLGRGGIAHTTEALVLGMQGRGHEVAVATRRGREIDDVLPTHGPGATSGNSLLDHLQLVSHVVRLFSDWQPATVVFQNYLIPYVEAAAHGRARRLGIRVVFAVHDHRLHSRSAGLQAGLHRLVRRADEVLVHSEYVRDELRRAARRNTCTVLPLPIPIGLEGRARSENAASTVVAADGNCVAITFGNLYRAYKGIEIVMALAASPPKGWQLAAVGPGAPDTPGLLAVDRFLGGGELWRSVAASAATLLPYRFATQSGAVVLAQACGSVAIATAIGGIPEQIEDGETGVLVQPGGGVEAWRNALKHLDEEVRRTIVAAGRRAVAVAHDRCLDGVAKLVAS